MKKFNNNFNISLVKKFIYRPFTTLIFGAIAAGAQGADAIDVDVIPHEFTNGTAADALEVNANFEFLRNNLDVLVSLVQEQQNKIALLESGGIAESFELSVDCAGGSFSDAVDPALDAAFPGGIDIPLSISVSGTCTGNTTIDIDDVTIKSADPDTPAVFTGLIGITGEGNHLELENLDIVTTGIGLLCFKNGSLRGTDLNIQVQGGFNGVLALSEGFCEINNSTITGAGGAARGVASAQGGYVSLGGVSVSGFNVGIDTTDGSKIWMGASSAGLSQSTGNNIGVLAFAGGSVTLGGANISDNANQGLLLQEGGSAIFIGGPATTIDNNTTGIEMNNGSFLYSYIGSEKAVISNNDTGIQCINFGGGFGLGSNLDLISGGVNTVDNNNCTNLPE